MTNADSSANRKQKFPLPPDLAGLPVIVAEPWFQVDSDPGMILEGPAFDKEDNLFITSPSAGKVFKITDGRHLDLIFSDKKIVVDGAAFHRDGRLFIACLTGELLVINPHGQRITCLYPKYQGKMLTMNDLVFDSKGNLYVTDFTGSIMETTGGVFRISLDADNVQPVVLHLASPNGISLAPEGNVLWVGESSRNSVLRVGLLKDGITCNPVSGVLPVYYSSGCPGPDSNKVDAAGNLYQCIMGQGRVVVLNSQGIPVASVIVPGREDGKCLWTANLAFKPGTNEGYITTSGLSGAWVFRFMALDKGLLLYSHQTE